MSEGLSQPAQSALHVGGPVADTLLDVTTVLTVGAVLIFGGVMLLLAMSLRGGPRPVRARRWLLGGGIALPVVVLSALFVYSERHRPAWRPVPPADALVVSVTGRMWWWEVRYDDPRTGRRFATDNEIRLPAGRPVYFALASEDVIHSFWVPALGGKMDMVPGRMQHLLLTAAAPGRWRGQCAEYCGLSHANMRLKVVVHSPEDYAKWEQGQVASANMTFADGSTEKSGMELFRSKGRGGCHTINGYTAGQVGPNLTHFMSRKVFAGAIFPNNTEELRAWLRNPPGQKPMMPNNGMGMPNLNLAENEISDLIAFLQTLK